jgi:hypothetical protein
VLAYTSSILRPHSLYGLPSNARTVSADSFSSGHAPTPPIQQQFQGHGLRRTVRPHRSRTDQPHLWPLSAARRGLAACYLLSRLLLATSTPLALRSALTGQT